VSVAHAKPKNDDDGLVVNSLSPHPDRRHQNHEASVGNYIKVKRKFQQSVLLSCPYGRQQGQSVNFFFLIDPSLEPEMEADRIVVTPMKKGLYGSTSEQGLCYTKSTFSFSSLVIYSISFLRCGFK
jgi:hypothetical protein